MAGLIGVNGRPGIGNAVQETNASDSWRATKVSVRRLRAGRQSRRGACKISRGGFTAAFLLQCLEAIGARDVRF